MRTQFSILLFLCIARVVFAQKDNQKAAIPFDSVTQKYMYVKIIEVANKTAPELYIRAKDWTKFKYADDKYLVDTENLQLNDLGNFTITVILKGGMAKATIIYTVLFNLKFYFKDGKCKFEICDIKLSQSAQGTTQEATIEAFEKQQAVSVAGKKIIADIFKEIDTNMLKLIAEIETVLVNGMNKKTDW